MAKIAILTPDTGEQGFYARSHDVFERLARSLRAEGLEIEGRAWTETGDLSAFDLVIPLLVWGYHKAGERWLEAASRWEQDGVRVRNAPSVLRWNADKIYLERLAERGAPVVRTLFANKLTPEVLESAVERFGTDRLIAKPRMSAGAWQTIRWSPGQPLDGGPTGAAMIQPYLPTIERSGEISLIFFSGTFSHAISKVPQPGDFRVQPEYDGIITPHQPDSDELAAAEAVLAAAGERMLYARVDLVRDPSGRPVLMELELVEPDLYLGYAEGAGAAFAAAVKQTASRDEPAGFGL